MLTLSVVVLATDRPPTLPACLAAIERAAGDGEVVVGDGPPVLSASAARNAGARRATGDVLVFVDAPPRRPGPGWAPSAVTPSSPRAGSTRTATRTPWSRTSISVSGSPPTARRSLLAPTIQSAPLKIRTLQSMVCIDFARHGVLRLALQLRSDRGCTALDLGWRHRSSAAACTLGALAVLARRPRSAATSLFVLLGLNRDFYALLTRRRGLGEAAVGLGLHAVHHLTALASVPAGVLAHVREDRGRAGPRTAPAPQEQVR